MGYKNIRLYAEGLTGWKKTGLPLVKDDPMPRPEIPALTPSQLQQLPGDVFVLDVRLVAMYEEGHIKGSRNIPTDELSRRFREIPTGKKIVVVHYLGNPEWMPWGWFLKSKGYTDVMFLKGGMNAWEMDGLPSEK